MAIPVMTAPHDEDDTHRHPPPSGLAVTAEHYESRGWLVRQVGDRLLLTTSDKASAVELPSGLAAEVQHYLTVRLLAGPVIILRAPPAAGCCSPAPPTTHRRST